jgi:hypothetical protein
MTVVPRSRQLLDLPQDMPGGTYRGRFLRPARTLPYWTRQRLHMAGRKATIKLARAGA